MAGLINAGMTPAMIQQQMHAMMGAGALGPMGGSLMGAAAGGCAPGMIPLCNPAGLMACGAMGGAVCRGAMGAAMGGGTMGGAINGAAVGSGGAPMNSGGGTHEIAAVCACSGSMGVAASAGGVVLHDSAMTFDDFEDVPPIQTTSHSADLPQGRFRVDYG